MEEARVGVRTIRLLMIVVRMRKKAGSPAQTEVALLFFHAIKQYLHRCHPTPTSCSDLLPHNKRQHHVIKFSGSNTPSVPKQKQQVDLEASCTTTIDTPMVKKEDSDATNMAAVKQEDDHHKASASKSANVAEQKQHEPHVSTINTADQEPAIPDHRDASKKRKRDPDSEEEKAGEKKTPASQAPMTKGVRKRARKAAKKAAQKAAEDEALFQRLRLPKGKLVLHSAAVYYYTGKTT